MSPAGLLLLVCVHTAVLDQAARQAGVPLPIMRAVAHVESSCRPEVTSPVGAQGLMQVMPFWTRTDLATRCGGRDLYDPAVNACYGARILRHYFERTGSWVRALARYSGGASDYFGKVRRTMRAQRRA